MKTSARYRLAVSEPSSVCQYLQTVDTVVTDGFLLSMNRKKSKEIAALKALSNVCEYQHLTCADLNAARNAYRYRGHGRDLC